MLLLLLLLLLCGLEGIVSLLTLTVRAMAFRRPYTSAAVMYTAMRTSTEEWSLDTTDTKHAAMVKSTKQALADQ